MQKNFRLALGQSAELSESEMRDLRRGSWEVDCPRLELKQRDNSKTNLYVGPGVIRQDEQHQLTYKIYCSASDDLKSIFHDEYGEAGTLIPETAFYDLTATDVDGRLWKSERILPGSFNWGATGEPVAGGRLNNISCEGQIPENVAVEGSNLLLTIFDKVEIPRNSHTSEHYHVAGWSRSHHYGTDAWRIRAAGFRFLFSNARKDRLQIHVASDLEKFPTYLEERVLESLFFLLGYPLYPTVSYQRTGHNTRCKIHSRRLRLPGARHQAPLPIGFFTHPKTGKLTVEPYRKLFERYLVHVLPYGARSHPLSGQTNAIYEASAGSFIDSQALTLSVAIESVLKNEFPDLARPSKEEKRLVDEVSPYFDNWNGDANLKRRVKGSISQFKSARAGDKMRVLAEKGVITVEAATAWQTLRNMTAHSYQSKSSSPDKMRELLPVVSTLFYQLAFYRIGYRGFYTDYGVKGWPLRQFPPLKSDRATGKEIE